MKKKKKIKEYKIVLLIITFFMIVLSPFTDTKSKKEDDNLPKTHCLNKNDFDKLSNNVKTIESNNEIENIIKDIKESKESFNNEEEKINEKQNEKVVNEELETEENIVEEEIEKSKKVAFTFDDGPSIYTKDLLEILKENNAKATFFVVGSRINKYGNTITAMKDDGHQIESHGVSHKDFTKLTNEELIKELKTTKELLAKYGVIQTLVRPPYGSVNKRVKETVDYPLIMWSVDTRDWEHRNSEKGTRIIIENIEDGSIILMHDLYKSTIETVKQVLPILKEEGYEIVTVSELFEETELEDGKAYYKRINTK